MAARRRELAHWLGRRVGGMDRADELWDCRKNVTFAKPGRRTRKSRQRSGTPRGASALYKEERSRWATGQSECWWKDSITGV